MIEIIFIFMRMMNNSSSATLRVGFN